MTPPYEKVVLYTTICLTGFLDKYGMISLENYVQVIPMKTKAILLAAVMVLSLLPGCSKTEKNQVAATTLPVYQFTTTLCEGTGITVTRLVTESVSCLHDYSLNVSQVRAIESAQVVILSGAGLEGFMDDLIADASAVIDSSAGMLVLGTLEDVRQCFKLSDE